MHITRARIRNYRGFFDSGDLQFSPGFNLVVGRNSTGKTILLNALGQRIEGSPHRSTQTVQQPGLRPDQTTRLTVDFELSGTELLVLALRTTDQLILPAPAGFREDEGAWASLLVSVFESQEIALRVDWNAGEDQGLSVAAPSPSARVGFTYALISDKQAMVGTFDVVPSRQGYVYRGRTIANPGQDAYLGLASSCRELIYRFDAERLRIGRGSYGPSVTLAPDARNLPEVLGNLQADKHRLAEYLALVREVLPDVRDVSVVQLTTNEQEVRVSTVDPSRRRGDLAIPLSRCGSGVGQVLAILYVIVKEDAPRVILIDEPNSFLHPGASRALISILKRYPQHQYIISTHSPEVMSALGPIQTTVLEWRDDQCRASQFRSDNELAASTALSVVGARLSDVFGYDQIVWCEGPSDALCLRVVLKEFFPSVSATAVVPVHTTGAFDRRRRAETIEIYRQLSRASALVPPSLGFIFDHEGCRTEQDRRDLERRTDVTVRLLPVRMIENLLVSSGAIAALIGHLEPNNGATADAVDRWLTEASARPEYMRDVPDERLKSNLQSWTHAKDLISDAVSQFTEDRHSYINTRDIRLLTEYAISTEPQRLMPAAQMLGELLRVAPRLPVRRT